MKRPLLALSLACLAAPAAWAATPIDQTRPLDPRGRIEVDNLKGRIQVRVWNRPEVRIGGSLGKGVEKLLVEGDRRHLVIRVQYPKRVGGNWSDARIEPTDLRLDVPLLADLELESVSADIDVVGTAASVLEIDSVSGDITVAGAPKQAAIESVSGDVEATLNSADASVESVSGDVRLRGKLDGEVHAETVSGDIGVDNNGLPLRRMSSASVSGDATVHVGLAGNGSLKAESVSGDIRLSLPRTLSARVVGESFSGSLRAPGARIGKPKYGPGSSFEHRYGNGSAEVRLETFSGDAVLSLD